MIDLPPELEMRVAKTQTTLCNAWILTRTDGNRLGFTDHDQPLFVDGMSCQPETGMTPGVQEQSLGVAGDTTGLEGALSSERITDDDILAGLYDGAYLDRLMVDWQRPDLFVRLNRTVFGEITVSDGAFVVEVRSAGSLLDRNLTRYFSRSCDAELGDMRCGVDLDAPGLRVAATIANGHPHTIRIAVSQIIDVQDFALGRMKINTGQAAGQWLNLVSIKPGQSSGEYTLNLQPGKRVHLEVGDEVELIAGCDKTFATCRRRFSNAKNFRGFPHIPTADRALNYPDEESVHDGSPLVL